MTFFATCLAADSCPHPQDAVSLVHHSQNQPPSAQPSQRQAESKPMPVSSCKSSAQHQSQPESTSASARRAEAQPVPVVTCRPLVHNQNQPPPLQTSARRAKAQHAPATPCKSSVLGRRDDDASHARSVQAAQRTHSMQNGDFSDAALEAAPLQLSQVLMGMRMGSKTPAKAPDDDLRQHHGFQGSEFRNVATRTAPESPVQRIRVEGKLQSAEMTGKSPRKAPVKLSKILMGMREGLSKISSDGNRSSSKDNTSTGIPGWYGTAYNGTGTSSNGTQVANVQAEAGLLKRLTSNGTYSDGNDATSLNGEGGIGADALMRRTNAKSKYAAKLDHGE